MLVSDAVRLQLIEQNRPVVTGYELFVLQSKLCRAGKFQDINLAVRQINPNRYDYNRLVAQLSKGRYIQPDRDFNNQATTGSGGMKRGNQVFRVIDVDDGSAEDIAGIVDPFCYVSYLSAMQRYGLTNRLPEALMISTMADWKVAAAARELEDFGAVNERNVYRFSFSRTAWPGLLRQRSILCYPTNKTPQLRDIHDSHARITEIGETFVQMLDRPKLCGGMNHVVEVWQLHANDYLRQIILAVQRAPEYIIKLRAGYLLDEMLGIRDPVINAWKKYAQPGGSQRLDPGRPFSSRHSEKWMLSLNA